MGRKISVLAGYFGGVPLILAFITLAIMFTGMDHILMASLMVLVLGGGATGIFTGRKLQFGKTSTGFILFLLPLAYTAVLWAVFMLVTGGFYGDEAWLVYGILHAGLAPIYFFSMLMGEGRLFLWAPLAYELAFIGGMIISTILKKAYPSINRKQLITVLSVFFLAMGTGGAVQWQRSKTVLPASYGFQYGGGYSSTDLTPYEVTNPDNKLPKLDNASTFSVKDPNEMPVLDGAEAAFPVYSAFANAVYEKIPNPAENGREVVTFTNTIYAYERLLSGEVDIYFGAEPSKEQREMAEKEGKELVLTPIGKEAFVFFVNPDNPVNNLKVNDIKGIYSGKITNWSRLGGSDEKIIAFQRPKNSGSQTLLEKIMGDTKIIEPLKEDVPEGMGGIIEQVADYRNYDNSIGYSFRFFATGMNPNSDIKLLAINGVKPDSGNISTGHYPFTASLYAITLKDNTKSAIQPFLEWMQGSQGQELVEKIGYIKLK
ncbi:PstS family phosphate ABC transporter substrate-binding protein [Neobacillus sp. Marseille-QA0830]